MLDKSIFLFHNSSYNSPGTPHRFLPLLLQVVKILNLYTPDEYEKKTEVSFIRKVQSKLGGRMDSKKEAQLLIDTKHMFPVTFPYNPSSVLLNEITIPESFHLDCVKRI